MPNLHFFIFKKVDQLFDVLIKDGIIVTMDPKRRILKDGYVAIEKGRIVALGRSRKNKAACKSVEEVIDASGKAVLPGLISGHTHAALTLLRGLTDGMRLDELTRKWLWPFENALRPEDSYVAVQLACLEMIKAGVTCFADMHFNMEAVAKAVQDSGLRASLSVAMMDQGHVPLASKEAVRQNEILVKKWHQRAGGRITCMFGPCTVRLASAELFLKARRFASRHKVGIHLHLSEVEEDVKFTQDRFNKRPVKYLNDIGVLGPDVLAAHCIWLNDEEMRILKRAKVNVVHNPTSNVKSSAGIAKVAEMIKLGINMGLGVDAAFCNNTLDMFWEMRVASLIQDIGQTQPGHLSPEKALEMATLGNAKALGIENEVGSIEVGKKADLILVNLKQPHLTPLVERPKLNLLSHLVYAISGRDVTTTIVDGQVVMRHRNVLTIDEAKVLKKAEETLYAVLDRSGISTRTEKSE
ncbi:MAG: amidohydrolase [Candidatus Bathyarchaeota archaeon]|nr:MAG: amidohydrolase [Candidatus Bathyarchaeota archaeon]